MGQRYILDTNTVIDYVGDKLPQDSALAMDKLVNDELNVSIIVKIETLGFNGEKSEMQKLKDFLSLAKIYYVDDLIADKTIDLRKTYRKLKLGDAIIAATALANNLILISRNTKDFEDIFGLTCINPYELK
jgi:predicted nucleic acid-binding protein